MELASVDQISQGARARTGGGARGVGGGVLGGLICASNPTARQKNTIHGPNSGGTGCLLEVPCLILGLLCAGTL